MTVEIERPEEPGPEQPDQDGRERRDEPDGGRTKARKRRPRWLVWTLTALAALLAIAVLTPLAVGWRVWYQARQDERPKSDAILVLGAAQYDGRPTEIFRWRLQHAAHLYRAGVAPAIVTVGGKMPGDRFTEAEAGRNWLVNTAKVPAAKVVAVPEGRDTLQSMQAAGRRFKQLKWDSAVIVTDPWHGLRSKKMAEDNGIKAAASPTRSGPSVQTRETQFNYIVRETGAYLSYVLLGHSVRAPVVELRYPSPSTSASK